ncbi:MAG: hypothetical protein LBV12_01325 [Puniceicoccales bacterium]|jgi:hypothetical protein|nr:hypothetical protein [Puniceicoccales bacterium]
MLLPSEHKKQVSPRHWIFLLLLLWNTTSVGHLSGQTNRDETGLIYQGCDPGTYFALEDKFPNRFWFSVTPGETKAFLFKTDKQFYPHFYTEVARGGEYVGARFDADSGGVFITGGQAQPMKSAANSQMDKDGYLPVYEDLAGAEIHIKMRGVESPLWKFNVMVLPVRNVKVNIYWAWDSSSPATKVTRDQAVEASVIDTLNSVFFSQAGIRFTLGESKLIDYPFDPEKKGYLETASPSHFGLAETLPYSTQYEQVNILMLANSDIPYASNNSSHARGATGKLGFGSSVNPAQMWLVRLYINNLQQTGMAIGPAAAHELGHVFKIPTNSTDKVYGYVAVGSHYIGPNPKGIYKGARHLMEAGYNPQTGEVSASVDHWLSHRDWYYANIQSTHNETKESSQ